MKRIALALLMMVCFTGNAEALTVDLSAISTIESSGNADAHNIRSGARGLYQITPICLTEWNNFHPGDTYQIYDLFNPQINTRIAYWYFEERIPQMIRNFKKQDTIENRLIAYNAGIWYVKEGKEIPTETKNYIKKYQRIVNG